MQLRQRCYDQYAAQNPANKHYQVAQRNPTCWKGSGVQTRRLMRAGRPSRLGNTAPPQLLRG